MRKQSLKQRLASPMRWLHIYSSMFGLVAILFFSVTGLTLNHPSWKFGSVSRESTTKGKIPQEFLKEPAKLEIVEHLRKHEKIRGLVDDFTIDDLECSITFKGPGYSADVFLDRETGAYQATQYRQGWVALMNDLHKGRDSGKAWSLVVDISAILLIIVSVTGIGLLLYIKRRRKNGLLSTLGGFAVLLLVLWLCVP
ncbi:MAG: PepSY-associated TM helix domain-containing protein [Luteolibacter sp.]